MNTLILTSGPQFYTKNQKGEKKAIKLNNEQLVDVLKNEVEKFENLLFICSSPDEYKKNEEYADIITSSLSLSGIKFHMADLIDSRNWLFAKGLINNSDLIILLGGDPLEQMEFFNNIELKDKIKKYKGVLMGISAGTINMAENAYCSKDEKIENTQFYKGLGVTNINVEPHFNIEDISRINEILLVDSNKKSFVALPDESFILVKKEETILYGEGYYFNEGNYNKIEGKISDILKKI